jgi:hypothetical protein
MNYVEFGQFGYMEASTNFGGRLRESRDAEEKFPGDCEHGPQEIQLDFINH